MKIGITCYPTYGGSGVVATELGKALAERGHEVHFITYAMPMRLNDYHDNIYYHEVELPTYPVFEHQLYTLALTGKLVDVVRFEKLDVIHMHYAIPHAISGYMAKQIIRDKFETRLVTTLHGTDITLIGLEPNFLPLVKFSIEQSDGVTAVSRFLREKTLSHFSISNKDIEVIPNFIDTEVYRPRETSELRRSVAPNGEKVLLHVSNFREVKRVPDTIAIMQHVLNHMPAKLLLVGDGPERAAVERQCRELGICEHVRFLGKQNDLPTIYAAADLMLLPSQSESFGLAALEAMACGVPVVATSSGGIPEVVVQGETGFIAEIGDTERMGRYAVDMLSNPRRHAIYRENARNRAVEQYETDLIVPQYEALYERVLNSERVGV